MQNLEIAGASGSLDAPSALQELRQEDQMDRSSLKAKTSLDSCKASLSRNAVSDVIHVDLAGASTRAQKRATAPTHDENKEPTLRAMRKRRRTHDDSCPDTQPGSAVVRELEAIEDA